MSAIYSLSTYSLATISNAVAASSGTPTIIWSATIPAGAKGRNAILQLFFNLFCASNFAAGQNFYYGLYVDGTPLAIGDSTTMKYVHTAANQYAISAAGVGLGTNPLFGYQPLVIPLAISPTASQIQLGITNSSLGMALSTSTAPHVTSNVTVSSGTLNTGNYIPVNTFTSTGTYTVPTTVQGGAVQGVFIYLWGGGGYTNNLYSGGGGGFVSGFYSCSPGTVIAYSIGSGGGGPSGGGAQGGGYTGAFLTTTINATNAIGIAGGGGGGNRDGGTYTTGGAGGYPTGISPYLVASNIYSTTNLGGSQTAGGVGGNANGSRFQGGNGYGGGGGGGGWFGGGGGFYGASTGTRDSGGAGGSSYIGNVNGATGGIGFTSQATYENGTTLQGTTSTPANTLPGGSTSPYYVSGYGHGNGGGGLVVIVPAIGTTAVQVGVSASLYAL